MSIEVAEGFKWVWDTFGKDLAKSGFDWAKKGFDWQKASMAYAERIIEDYGKVQILGRANRVPLENVYTAVNVLEKPTALRRYSREQLHDLFMQREALLLEKDKRSDGLDLVKTGKNYFILGKPGAGKTTFLKSVAINAVQGLIHTAEIPKTPIFISLKAHADSERSLFESVQHELSICRFPESEPFVKRLLHSHDTIVLLDGLDEVKQEDDVRNKLIQDMREFMREYRESQFLITCRVAATEYEFDNVAYIEMADFDDVQVEKFIYNWFDDDAQAQTCWQELSKGENKGLREMARVPLLLALLAITYEDTQTFPKRRIEIYEETLDALLKKWDAGRQIWRDEPYKALSLGRKRQMFARIAAETFGDNNFLPTKTVLGKRLESYIKNVPEMGEDIDGEAILESIAAQHGIFVERAKGIFSFAHLSFQEYYTAKYIIDDESNRAIRGLFNHTSDDQWREVFLFTANLLDQKVADEFFKMFIATVNDMVQNQQEIQSLLTGAKQKAETVEASLSFKMITLQLWFARIFALDYILTLDTEPNQALSNIRNRASISKRARSLDISHLIEPDTGTSLALTNRYVLEAVVRRSNKSSSTIIERGSSEQEWRTLLNFTDTILKEVAEPSDDSQSVGPDKGHEPAWSAEAHDAFVTYYQANKLLIECLDLAKVTDRDAILNQLFLPVSES